MVKEFRIEILLTVVTGINCCEDFNDVRELYHFVFNAEEERTNTMFTLKQHLIFLHPQLAEVHYNSSFETSFEAWIRSQKQALGETLPVCPHGETINKKVEGNHSR